MKKTMVTLMITAIVSTVLSVSVFAFDFGSKETIQQIQEALNQAGYDCGTPDGVTGGKTATAISAYRKDNGLPEGTEIDEGLYQSLMESDDDQHFLGKTLSDDECLEKTFIPASNEPSGQASQRDACGMLVHLATPQGTPSVCLEGCCVPVAHV